MLFVASILLVVTPFAYFPPPPLCAAEGAVLVNPGDDRAVMGSKIAVISNAVSWTIQKPGGARPSSGLV